MLRLLAIPGELLFIAAHLTIAAAFGGFFMLAYPIFLLAFAVDGSIRFIRRLCFG